MKRILLGLLVCIMFFASACQKQGALTPPIATPNQNLPLYEMEPATSGGTDADLLPSPGDGEYAKPDITATPSTIKTYKSGSNFDSYILVEDGSFSPNSTVSIWGVATDVADITSPPWVYEEDTNQSVEKIQLVTNEAGGLNFWVRAGNDIGVFTIMVAGATPPEKGAKAGAGDPNTPGIDFLGYSGYLDMDTNVLVGKVLSVTLSIVK